MKFEFSILARNSVYFRRKKLRGKKLYMTHENRSRNNKTFSNIDDRQKEWCLERNSKDYNAILSFERRKKKKNKREEFLSSFFFFLYFLVNYIWRKTVSGVGWNVFYVCLLFRVVIYWIFCVHVHKIWKFVFFKFNIFSMAHQLVSGLHRSDRQRFYDKCWLIKWRIQDGLSKIMWKKFVVL